jgi:uncharacterized RDD family membrane protein YckC
MADLASLLDTKPHTSPSYGPPAEWAKRAVAYLIDAAPLVVLFFVGPIVASPLPDALGFLVSLAVIVVAIAYGIINLIIAQGRSGQTFGKKQQGLRLVSQATNLPLGPGMVLVRYLVAGVLSSFTCGIYGLLDLLWPLWDADKARLTDKILKNKVVVV